jgi:hypothetical protein
MIIISGMISISPTEINRLKRLLRFINASLILIQASLKLTSLRRKVPLISASTLLEAVAQKELIVDFIIELHKKKISK